MTDTTGQMSPELEAEVSKVRAVFDRVTNAVVDASNLRTEVNTLRNEVDILKRDTESLRSRNNELDVALADVRKQRDDANSLLSDTRNKLWEAEREREDYKTRSETQYNVIASLQEQVARLTKERDDAIMASLQHEEAAKSANAKLEDIRGYASKVFGFDGSTKPAETAPVEVPAFLSRGGVDTVAGQAYGPVPVNEVPKPFDPSPVKPHSEDSWDLPPSYR